MVPEGESSFAAQWRVVQGYAEEIAGNWTAAMRRGAIHYNGKRLRASSAPAPHRAMQQRAMGGLQDFLRAGKKESSELRA